MIVLQKLRPTLHHLERRLFFSTGLRLALALAMCASLAHSFGKSWCGVINSPATTFAIVIKPPRGRLVVVSSRSTN